MILVTGGTGFTGSYLLRSLAKKGQAVRATYRSHSDFSLIEDIKDQIEWVECDLLDLPRLEKIIKGVDQVYHAAAVVSFEKQKAEWMMNSNVSSTRNVVNCCLAFNVKKLVFTSSISALGRRKKKEAINEQAVWERSKYNSNYGTSKFRSEREVWRGIAEGLNAAIVNPSVIMGAGRWDNGTPQMFRSVYHGLPAVPKGVTGFVDVRDVVDIMIRLMESDISGERFILNSESISYPQLFALIARSLNKKPPGITVNRWQGTVVAYLENIFHKLIGGTPRVHIEYARNFGNEYFYENDKIREALKYDFIPLGKTINDTGAAFMDTYPKGKPGRLSL